MCKMQSRFRFHSIIFSILIIFLYKNLYIFFQGVENTKNYRLKYLVVSSRKNVQLLSIFCREEKLNISLKEVWRADSKKLARAKCIRFSGLHVFDDIRLSYFAKKFLARPDKTSAHAVSRYTRGLLDAESVNHLTGY